MSHKHQNPIPEHVNEDWLINLLNDLLKADEKRAGLAHLQDCPECEAHFQRLARDRERLVAAPGPRFVDGRIVFKEQRQAPVPWRRKWFGGVSAAAAAILLFLGGAWWQARTDVLEYWLPVGQPEALLRSSPPSQQAENFLAGLEAYRARDARRALELLRNAQVEDDEASLRDLYIASALVLSESYAEADSVLRHLDVSTLPQPWRRQAQWVHYISLRKTGQSRMALKILEKLIDEPGEIGELARHEWLRLQP